MIIQNVKKIVQKVRSIKITWYVFGILALFFIVFLGLILYKHYYLKYDELDLAIFNQVLFNTVHGRFLENSIQGQNYWGDHFAPLLLLIIPIYFLFQSPITLLVIQLLGIICGGWMLFLCCRKILNSEKLGLFFVVLYVLNFSIQQIGLFGFHMLPFFFVIFFGLYYAYRQRNFTCYVFMIMLALLLREDVALVIIPFSIIPLLDKRSYKWWLTPLVTGIIYFPISLYIISLFNYGGGYKFLQLYGWLGTSYFEIIKTIFFHPIFVLKNLSWGSLLELFLGFLLPFFFVPIYAMRWGLVLLGIFVLHALQRTGIEQLILQTHYSALFWPILFVAVIEVFEHKNWGSYKNLVLSIIFFSSLYTMILLGPTQTIMQAQDYTLYHHEMLFIQNVHNEISDEVGVIASSDLLPMFSSREHIYSLHYLFWGTRQFSDQEYYIDDSVEYILVNQNDFRFFLAQSYRDYEKFNNGIVRLNQFLRERNFMIHETFGNYIIFKKSPENSDKNNSLDFDFINNNHQTFTELKISSCKINSSHEKLGFIPVEFTFEKVKITAQDVVVADAQNLPTINLTELDQKRPLFLEFKYNDIQTKSIQYFINYGYDLFLQNNESQQTFIYWIPKSFIDGQTDVRILQKQEVAYFNHLGFVDYQTISLETLQGFILNQVCLIN